ncbi:hypothetical protein LRS06_10355 [Hymenobacter sp. J193]|nr:hypothetical protein [Hymenobacter sp. J193]MCR5888164.1 hypothetical protein [Hymenobacter sp. J193]
MNRRHRHCIDLLMNEREIRGRMDDLDFGRWEKVRITKVTAPAPDWSEG